MVFDYGTSVNYEGDGREPNEIAHIKEKVVKKTMTMSANKEPKSKIFRAFDPLKSNHDDVIRKARTSILHEDDESIHTTRAERIQRAMRDGIKIPLPAGPEPDPTDK